MSTPLGPRHELALPQGTITYRDAGARSGSNPVVVFVHGLLVNGDLWAQTAERVLPHARVVLPDLPMGAHRHPMPVDADLGPPGLADLVADLLEVLDLREVVLVGNDNGGGVSQLLVTRRPERVGGLVLTNCDAYDHFPPTLLRPLPWLARHAGGPLGRLAGAALQRPAVGRLVLAAAQHRRPDAETLHSYFAPIADPAVQRDTVRLLAGIRRHQILDASRTFPAFRRPVLVTWGSDDLFFPRSDALRLARDFPDAELVDVPDARTFVAADQPDRLAELIADFLTRRVSPVDQAAPVSPCASPPRR